VEQSATHPAFPSVVVSGRTTFEWLEGQYFLIGRSRNDHSEFPDGLTVLGAGGEALSMHYCDSRGVERDLSGKPERWRLEDVARRPRLLAAIHRRRQRHHGPVAPITRLRELDADLEITYGRLP